MALGLNDSSLQKNLFIPLKIFWVDKIDGKHDTHEADGTPFDPSHAEAHW